jgi:hypothetical protein
MQSDRVWPELSPQALYLCKPPALSGEWAIGLPFLDRRTRNKKCNLSGGKRMTGSKRADPGPLGPPGIFCRTEVTKSRRLEGIEFHPGCPCRVEMDVRARRDRLVGIDSNAGKVNRAELTGDRPELSQIDINAICLSGSSSR